MPASESSPHSQAGQSTRYPRKLCTRIATDPAYLPLQVESLPDGGPANPLGWGSRLARLDPRPAS